MPTTTTATKIVPQTDRSLLSLDKLPSDQRRLLNMVYSRYDLASPIDFTVIAEKNDRTLYSLETLTGTLIVKVLEEIRTLGEVRSATEVCRIAQEKGVPVPDIVRTSGGKCYTHHGKRYVYLYRFADGDGLIFNQGSAEFVGRMLARLHSQKPNAQITKKQFIPAKILGQCKKMLDSLSLDDPYYWNFIEETAGRLHEFDKLPVRLVHGDLSYGNILRRSSKVMFLIDFDEAGQGTPILELGYILAHLVTFNPNLKLQGPRGLRTRVSPASKWIDTFLNEYQKERPLSAQEKELLPMATKLAMLRWTYPAPTPEQKAFERIDAKLSQCLK